MKGFSGEQGLQAAGLGAHWGQMPRHLLPEGSGEVRGISRAQESCWGNGRTRAQRGKPEPASQQGLGHVVRTGTKQVQGGARETRRLNKERVWL